MTKPGGKLRQLLGTDTLLPYWLLIPAVLYLILFFVIPLSQAFFVAFQDDGGQWTLKYFQRMIKDFRFDDAVKYTFLLAIAIVPLQLITALMIALLVHLRFRGSQMFLYICAIPLGLSDLAAGLVWLSIFADRGYLNSLLHALGLTEKPITILSYEHVDWLFGAVVVAEHWRATAIVLVVLVAGLQMISKDYLESADVLGANRLQKLWYVILPLLRPSLQAALIIRTIFAFEIFAVVVALAGDFLPVLAGEAYNWYFLYQNLHIASAYAVLIMLISVIITVFYLRFFRIREEERR
jgi:multiple sugar transport system permease protein